MLGVSKGPTEYRAYTLPRETQPLEVKRCWGKAFFLSYLYLLQGFHTVSRSKLNPPFGLDMPFSFPSIIKAKPSLLKCD